MENNSNKRYDLFDEGDTRTFKDYLNLIRQNLAPVLIISLAGLLVAVLYAVTATDIYRSTTTLKLSKPQGNILEAPLMPEFQDFGSDRFVANEIELLKSFRVRERVANDLVSKYKKADDKNTFSLIVENDDNKNLTLDDVKPKMDIVDMLSSTVEIEQKRGLDFVEISVESPSPAEAAMIANDYADAYRELNLLINRQQLISVKEFLSDQRGEKLAELRESENALQLFQEEGGIVELDEQAKALIEQMTDFESQRNATQIEMTIAEQTLEKYKQELEDQNPKLKAYLDQFAAEPYLKSLQQQIAQLEMQRDLALSSTTSGINQEAAVQEYDRKLNDLREKLNNKIDEYKEGLFASSPEEIKGLTQKILETEVQYQAMQNSYRQLSQIVDQYESRFEKLPKTTIDLARLERERAAVEKLYLIVEEKYQEALINEKSAPGNVLIVDNARIPEKPSKPNRAMIILIGLVLGVGMGLGFAFVRDYFDNTIKTPEDIQNKNINVLAWIPQIEGLNAETKKDMEFIVAKRPDSIPSEAFRAFRTRIQFSKIGKDKIKTILATSSTPQEGKTLVSLNLAGSFAQTGKKVIYVDCDLRKPRVHTVFGAKRFPGFTDYFFDQATYEEIVRKSELNNFYYITAGTIPPNPSELLGSQQMEEFLEKLKSEFDLVVLDSPPIIAVTDSEILSRMVDATVLVVSANKTEVDLMEKSVELLSHDHGSFVGVLLNNFSYRSGYGSYYKYYYYYSKPSTEKAAK